MKNSKIVLVLLCLVFLLGTLPLLTMADDEIGNIVEGEQIEQLESSEESEEAEPADSSEDSSQEIDKQGIPGDNNGLNSKSLKAAPVMLSAPVQVTQNNITYSIDLDSKTASVVSGKADSSGVISVPDMITYDGQEYPVTSVSANAFYGKYGLVWSEVCIGANVESIGANAFGSGLDEVSKIQFNGSKCQSIAADAFDWISLAYGFELVVMGPEGCMDSVLSGVIDLADCEITYIDEHEPSIDIQQLVNEAPDNEEYTIKISEDITLKKSISIPSGKNIVITDDDKGYTIKSSKMNNVEELFNVYSGASLTFDGAITFVGGKSSSGDQGNIVDVSGGTFILRNGTLKNGEIAYHRSGAVLVRNGGTFTMSGGSVESFKLNGATLTAPVVVSPGSEFVFNSGTIKDNVNYSGNRSPVSSGVLLYTWNSSDLPAKMTMNGGRITDNKYCSGIYLIGSTDFKMNDGTISNNEGGYGGGVCVAGAPSGQSSEDFTTSLIMNGGSISGNEAYNAGGGIYVNSSDVILNGGRIENNIANSHGGGVYVSEMPYVLHVNNAVITDNTASVLGGGLWFCPSGEAYINVTRGIAVYDNSSSGSGDDFVSVGKGTGHVTLAQRMLGGGKVNWYVDGGVMTLNGQPAPLETGSPDPSVERYNPDNPGQEVTAIASNAGYALKAVSSDSAKELAMSKANLVITGNTAARGGGIGSNGVVVFGDDNNEWSVKVTKAWDLNESAADKSPVTVYLKIGDTVLDSVELSEENNWTAEFTGLPAPDSENGIEYSVVENPVPENYKPEYSTAEYDTENHIVSIRIKNSYITPPVTPPDFTPLETVVVAGEKTWVDNNNQDNKRPEHIKINLLADGKVIRTKTVTSKDDWKWSFTLLPKKDALGKDIEYTVSEEPVPGYMAVYDNYSIKNIYTGGTLDIPVNKVWDDDGDSAGKRPSSVTIFLYANQVKVEDKSLVLSKENNWSGEFSDLPEYRNDVLIDYEIREAEVDAYEAEVSGDMTTGYTVTNRILDVEDLGKTDPIDNEDETDNKDGYNKDNAKTGDTTHMMFWTLLMIIDFIILVVISVLFFRKKQKAHSN